MSKCMYCKQDIEWLQRSGRWVPTDQGQRPHDCRKRLFRGAHIAPGDAVCSKCWCPIVGTSSKNPCNCVSPEWVHKKQVKDLKSQLRTAERQE